MGIRVPGRWAHSPRVVLLVVLGWVLAWMAGGPGYVGPCWGMMPCGWIMGGWTAWMPLMVVSTLLFWVAVVLGLVAVVRWAAGHAPPRDEQVSEAMETARRRYARGEISREEFERLREDLVRPT